MQSCAVSSGVSLMFQKGSDVEKKYLYSELLRGKKSRKKGRKEGKLNAGEKSKTISFSERSGAHFWCGCKAVSEGKLQGLMYSSDKQRHVLPNPTSSLMTWNLFSLIFIKCL